MKTNTQAALVDCDGLAIPRRHWSTAAIWLAMTMAVLDGGIANIALPTIAHDGDYDKAGADGGRVGHSRLMGRPITLPQ